MTIVLYRPDYASVRLIACSPPSWMVALVLEEKGCPYEERVLDFAKGEHRTAEMLELNPRGTIPVLTDEGVVSSETLAMLEYIDFAYPQPSLMPMDLVGRAHALDALHASSHLKAAGMAWFAHLMRHGPGEAAEALRAAFVRETDRWERALAKQPYACGETATLADFAIFVYLATARHLGHPLSPALQGFHERMRGRPCVDRTWPATWTNHGNGLA